MMISHRYHRTPLFARACLALALLSLAACGGGGGGGSSSSSGGSSSGGSSPPAAPSGLVATAGNAVVTLSWKASTGATAYKVERSTTSGGAYATVGSPSTTTYTDSGLSNGTTYYYVVEATNAGGSSAPSAQVSATPQAPPAAPAGLVATAGNGQVSLSWTGSPGALSYTVLRATTTGGPYSAVASSSVTSFLDSAVVNDTTYYYVVEATNAGGSSVPSTQVSATPAAPPAAPAGLVATPGNGQVSLSWTGSPGALSYGVLRASTAGGPYTLIASPSVTTYLDNAVVNGTTYYYVATATDAAGTSADSTQAAATPSATIPVPPAPTGLAATTASGQVVLTWSASAGATAYAVERATTKGGPYTILSSPTATGYTDSALTNGTVYYYVVAGVNGNGRGPISTECTVVASAAPPIPACVTATGGNSVVSISWSATGGATSYTLSRATASGGPYTALASPALPFYYDTTISNGTTYYYEVTATTAGGTGAAAPPVVANPAARAITVTVTPGATHAISPYIYGVNFVNLIAAAPYVPLTLDRLGGNRWTAYNWVTNASNAGNDDNYQNDNFLVDNILFANQTPPFPPGAAATSAITPDQEANRATMVTFQMQGLVAADESGPVPVTNPPVSDAANFEPVKFQKGAPFTTTPTATPAVYMDEFAWNLNQLYPGKGIFAATPTGQPVFGELDNEPEIWNQTHYEVQGASPIGAAAFITRSIALARALKTQFPTMKLFGPVHYGFPGIYNWNNDPTVNATQTGNDWFADQYIAAVQAASKTAGYQLVDAYDFHWYTQVTDSSGTSILDQAGIGPSLTGDQVYAIVQSPRSLWDPAYTERSAVATFLGGPVNIVGRLQAKIATAASPMKVAITEYNNGGSKSIAGAIAQADNLGAFGALGLYAATLWELYYDANIANPEPYTLGAFAAYRNFDGAGAVFGDTSVQASSSDNQTVTAYVSTDSAVPGRVVIVAINRSTSAQTTTITGQPLVGTAHFYQLTAASTAPQSNIQPVSAGTQGVSGSSLTVTLPALSVTTIDIHN